MILYLGLDPSRWVSDKPILHYPVIRAAPRYPAPCSDYSRATHLLFTSKTAVIYWKVFTAPYILAVGEATAELLRKKGLTPLVAPEATQEGMIDLLRTLDLHGTHVIWPRSSKARDVLTDYLYTLSSIAQITIVDLYEIHYQKLDPIPSLDDIEEIVFTSPSTVEGFFRIYGYFPQDKRLTSIGPITEKALRDFRYTIDQSSC